MNTQEVSFKRLKLLYYQYKDTLAYQAVLVLLLISIGLYLLMQFVLPQIGDYFSIQREVDAVRERIAAIEENEVFLGSQDPSVVDEQRALVVRALPFRTDFTGIISALTYISSVTGMPVNDIQIDVGDESIDPGLVATVDFQFDLPTDIDGANRFINELSTVLPLASVSDVSYNGGTTNVLLSFYHRGLPQLNTDVTQPIVPLTAKELDLLSRLREYGEKTRQRAPVSSPIATQSGGVEIAIPPL